MNMEAALKGLQDDCFGEVIFIWDNAQYYYFLLTYIDGKQDDIKVRKKDGMKFWKPVDEEDWIPDYQIGASA